MDHQQSVTDDRVPSHTEQVSRLSTQCGSHGVALTQPRTGKMRNKNRLTDISTPFYLTVRMSNHSLTKKHIGLILDTLLYEIYQKSEIRLSQFLMVTHLFQILMGEKTEPTELNYRAASRVILVRSLIKALSDQEFLSEDMVGVLPEKHRQQALDSGVIISRRTYDSRRVHWKPEKWLAIRSVPVDELIERTGKSERYSSYCKGYGESHPSAHFKSTPPSAELDGEEPGPRVDFSLTELVTLLHLNSLDLAPKKSRK